MKADKRAKRAKQKTKAANVARQREKVGGKFYGVPIPNDFLIDLINFLHDQKRPDCDEILNGLYGTMQKSNDTNVFNQEWIKRAVEKRKQINGVYDD